MSATSENGRLVRDFIIVGGVCAVLQGVPVTTADLNIVHRRNEDNVSKLLAALDALDARSRLDSRGQGVDTASTMHMLLTQECAAQADNPDPHL